MPTVLVANKEKDFLSRSILPISRLFLSLHEFVCLVSSGLFFVSHAQLVEWLINYDFILVNPVADSAGSF